MLYLKAIGHTPMTADKMCSRKAEAPYLFPAELTMAPHGLLSTPPLNMITPEI